MCLHVVNCRMFQNQTINLNAKYTFSFKPDDKSPILTVDKNSSHVDLFEGQGVNLQVICGVNGSGKTTLLNILKGRQRNPSDVYYVVFKDSRDRFFSNRPLQINFMGQQQKLILDDYRDYALGSIACASSSIEDVEEFDILKGIALFYHNDPSLFDFEDHELFSHFQVEYWDLQNNAEAISHHLIGSIGLEVNSYDVESIAQKTPLSYMLLHISQDNTFEDIFTALRGKVKSLSDLINRMTRQFHDEFEGLDRQLYQIMYAKDTAKTPRTSLLDVPSPRESAPVLKEYKVSQYIAIDDHLTQTVAKVYTLFSQIYPSAHIDKDCRSILFFNMFWRSRAVPPHDKRFLNNLSTGEYMNIWYKYHLLPSMAQLAGCWIAEDEADIHLHPEWKRTFLANYLGALQETRRFLQKNPDNCQIYRDKVYSIVLTTHSPFLLSDLPADHIVLLEKKDDGQSIARAMTARTFAGNIGQMFYDNFFMSETIGQFATAKIQDILKELDHPITLRRKGNIIRVCNLIADDLLRNLLLDRINQTKVYDEANSNYA